ncbi:MAG: sugar ABC transporter permease [Anaerolineaceae bacterium]|nr:sugar ABC transporter permease [Anaerolineaceae bacterium]
MTTMNPIAPEKKRSNEKNWWKKIFHYQLLFPALLLLVLIQVYPTLYTLNLSFNSLKGGKLKWVGLDNFIRLFNSFELGNALEKTATYAGGYIILVIVLGMCIALLLNKRPLLAPLYLTILFVPWVLSEVVSGTMWRWLFNQDYGIVQVALNPFINDTSLLANKSGAMLIVIVSSVWRSIPFTSLLFLAALQTVSTEIKEAASLDGASPWQSFWRITIPIISPTLLVVLLLNSITGINQLGLILSTTGGGPGTATTTTSVLLYREAFKYGNFGAAAAISVFMFIINLVLTLIYIRVIKVEAEL